jgi:hypothetical protein
MNMWKCCVASLLFLVSFASHAASILIPMDESQKNHLKAYGIIYLFSMVQKQIGY